MRKIPAWKSVLLLVLCTALAPLRAQQAPAPMSTSEQLALLNKIQGVGDLKFGATLDSFDKGDLQSTDNPNAQPTPTVSYIYTPTRQITWGTLVPTGISLTFYYKQLVSITLRFNETNATLISVNQAFLQKYGSTHNNTNFTFNVGPNAASASFWGNQWRSDNLYICVSLPDRVPEGATDDFLTKNADGAVQIFDTGLQNKLTQQKQDALRSQLLKDQNLDKIKADL